ncbi:MAG: Rne/Rng family ribonuclease [Clostridiales bacterium]|nr:Rne/Rng family ribonuclease [Clostridiales bacterium]
MKSRLNDNAEKVILVDVNHFMTRVMLLENGIPVEYYIERRSLGRLVGNIYKGRVQNVLPGMFAAFVDIKEQRNAFLYAGDIIPDPSMFDGEQFDGKPTPNQLLSVIRSGQDIMVQIIKEPIGTKGARATTQITLPGRLLVFMPLIEFVGISKRITNDAERKRLKGIIASALPKGMGVIVRTAAEGLDEELIVDDLNSLIREWEQIQRRYNEVKAPAIIHKDDSLISRTVRDMFTGNVKKLVVNDKEQYELICSLVPENCVEMVEYYEGADLFDRYGVEQEIDAALSRRVWLKSGAYIIIDQTEALTSIDVNTGKYTGNVSLGKTIVDTNKEAAVEIARQLRLRDIGGIIIIDFIDMEDEHDRIEVMNMLNEHLRCDGTKSVVLGMTQLGLVEVTRKKLGSSISASMQETCPYCHGSGLVLSPEIVALKIRREILSRIDGDPGLHEFTVTANPAVIKILEENVEEDCIMTPELSSRIILFKKNPAMHVEDYSIKNI